MRAFSIQTPMKKHQCHQHHETTWCTKDHGHHSHDHDHVHEERLLVEQRAVDEESREVKRSDGIVVTIGCSMDQVLVLFLLPLLHLLLLIAIHSSDSEMSTVRNM